MSIFNLFGQGKKNENQNNSRYTDSETKGVFTCNHVIEDKKPILYVEHDIDDDWQFLCGRADHTEDNAKIISLKEATELDETLNDLVEMPVGIGAERKALGEKWTQFKIYTE